MLSRLGVAQNVQHTARPDAAVRNLTAAREEMTAIDARLAAARQSVAADFPLSPPEVEAFRARLAERITVIHDTEAAAMEVMKAL